MASEITDRIAWVAISIGILMQVMASLLPGGTSLAEPFEDVPEVDSVGSFFEAAGAIGLGIVQFLFGFLQQSWAVDFPPWLRWPILAVFDLALLLMISSNVPLLVIAGIAALAAALDALVPG